MASVGEKLRKARLDGGLELSEIADRTKISSRYLDAIERDDRSGLPGGFFYKNWVLQYAACLCLDLDEIAREVDLCTAQDEEPELPGQRDRLLSTGRPAPIDIGRPGGERRMLYPVTALVVVVMVCSGFYAWWTNSQSDVPVMAKTEQSEATPAIVPAAPATTPDPVPPAAAAIVPALPVGGANAAVPSGIAASVGGIQAAGQAPSPEKTQDGVTAYLTPISSDDVRIDIAALQETWVSVAPDGKEVFSGILQPPQVRTLGAHDSVRIRIGNAGGLGVRLNGRPIGPIGPAGQVRTLIINKTGYQIIEPKISANTPTEGALNDRAAVTSALNQ